MPEGNNDKLSPTMLIILVLAGSGTSGGLTSLLLGEPIKTKDDHAEIKRDHLEMWRDIEDNTKLIQQNRTEINNIYRGIYERNKRE